MNNEKKEIIDLIHTLTRAALESARPFDQHQQLIQFSQRIMAWVEASDSSTDPPEDNEA